MSRNLREDLGISESFSKKELTRTYDRMNGDYMVYANFKHDFQAINFQVFFKAARERWPEAIRRALAAEARVKELEDALERIAVERPLTGTLALTDLDMQEIARKAVRKGLKP